MSGDTQETAPQALRELAQWVVRDGIDGEHLDGYMRRLLSARLVELHAECRLQAMVVARCCSGLDPRDVACRLCETAREIERASGPHAGSAAIEFRPSTLMAHTMDQVDYYAAEKRPGGSPISAEPASYVPEFVTSVLFIAIAVGFLMNWPGALFPRSPAGNSDRILQLTVAVAYMFLGLLSAYEGARRAGWYSRSRDRG